MEIPEGTTPFRLGFGLGIVLFIISNIVSAVAAANEYATRKIKFAHDGYKFAHDGYSWGFPLRMFRNFDGYPNDVGFEMMPAAINGVIAAIFAGILGIVLQVVADRFRKD